MTQELKGGLIVAQIIAWLLVNALSPLNRTRMKTEEDDGMTFFIFITSLYKKGYRKDRSNYRGLSVNSTLSKLFGKVIKAQLEDQIIVIVSEKQYGRRLEQPGIPPN